MFGVCNQECEYVSVSPRVQGSMVPPIRELALRELRATIQGGSRLFRDGDGDIKKE
jgi:hypothetical protein